MSTKPAPPSEATDRCPRCGAAFHCGVDDPEPCPCTTVTLDAAQLASLRARYVGCLCMRCLAELSGGVNAAPAPGAS